MCSVMYFIKFIITIANFNKLFFILKVTQGDPPTPPSPLNNNFVVRLIPRFIRRAPSKMTDLNFVIFFRILSSHVLEHVDRYCLPKKRRPFLCAIVDM